MIQLQVAQYCYDCPNFVPDSERAFLDGEPVTVVVCTNRIECYNIKKYLEKLNKAQMGGVLYSEDRIVETIKGDGIFGHGKT